MHNHHEPTFSVFSVIKNIESRKDQFLRSVQSVLSQDFADLEFVIQDGASTDATLDILYGIQDSRIVVASEEDSGPEEGFFRALKRCCGRYIASCSSDEELAPDALQNAFNIFQENQDIAAFYGNYGSVNEHGKKWGSHIPGHPFAIEGYVCQKIVPPFCSSFFRRSHLEKAGLHTHQWRYNIGEFEFWIRVAGTGNIIYKPLMLSYFGRHSGSNTANAWLYDVLTSERTFVMQKLFDENDHLQKTSVSVDQAISGNYIWAANSVKGIEGDSERNKKFMRLAYAYDPLNPIVKSTKKLTETTKKDSSSSLNDNSANSKKHNVKTTLDHWLSLLSVIENRLYYRDQSANSLNSLITLAQSHRPSIIVELGTLSGMSTRAWVLALPNARIHAVDLSFKAFWKANEHFPVDTTRITFHEQNILSMDFKALWSDSDRVLFFVDAHDLANVPIMRHVLKNALPYLPKDSLVVVDDIWFSQEQLDPDNVQEYFNQFLLGQIDELQCFTGHYAPYHKGGSFMGFREVVPLMHFVNSRGIELEFEPEGKHVWFAWDGGKHSTQQPEKKDFPEDETGEVEYNPLDTPCSQPLAKRIMPKAARIYRQGQIAEAAKLLVNVINKEPSPEACYALAICQARVGQLDDAHKLAQMALKAGGSQRMYRLAHDLDARVGKPKVRMTGQKGLTIFAVPKPFTGHERIIQRNAIRSWARMTPAPEIILMGDDPGVREMALEVGAKHIPHIAANEYGTPLVDDIFKKAWDTATNDILAYVNADIILMDDFQLAVAKVINQFQDFLVIGQRWDLPVWEEIDFSSPGWIEMVKKDVQENGFLHAETGLDYFIHPRGLWRGMPPFALGRTAWDNWLVKRPFEDEIPIIDGTGFITAVHQDHGYGHCQGGREGAWRGVEAIRNRAMAGTIGDTCYVNAATWMVSREGQLMRANPGKPSWQTDEARNIRRDWLMTQSKRLKSRGRFDLAKAYLEIASAT